MNNYQKLYEMGGILAQGNNVNKDNAWQLWISVSIPYLKCAIELFNVSDDDIDEAFKAVNDGYFDYVYNNC